MYFIHLHSQDTRQQQELLAIADLKSMLSDLSNFDHAIKTAFDHIDSSTYGQRISRDDFLGVFRDGSALSLRDAEVLALYDMLDQDKDGFLIPDELDRKKKRTTDHTK